MIAIIDYDAGNIKKCGEGIEFSGTGRMITRDTEEILYSRQSDPSGCGSFW